MSRVLIRLAAVVAALAAAGSAQAAFSVTLSVSGSPSQTFNMSDAGGNASGTIGGYSFQVSSFGNSPGVGNTALLTQTTIAVTGSGQSPLTVVTSSNGFTAGAPGGTASVLTSLGGSTLPTGSASAFSTITPGGSTTPISISAGTPPAPNSNTGVFTSVTTPFALANSLTLTGLNGTASVTVTSTATVTPVPAPPALLLVGLAAPALGLVRRWTRKAPQPAAV